MHRQVHGSTWHSCILEGHEFDDGHVRHSISHSSNCRTDYFVGLEFQSGVSRVDGGRGAGLGQRGPFKVSNGRWKFGDA